MKNKKGFTLVELLCVVIIMAIIVVVASAGVMKLSQNSKENMYCAKLEFIKTKALEYGVSHEKEINNSSEYYKEYKSIKIKVQDLIDSNRLETDRDGKVISPIDDEVMNELEIIIYLKNNQINIYIESNIC